MLECASSNAWLLANAKGKTPANCLRVRKYSRSAVVTATAVAAAAFKLDQ